MMKKLKSKAGMTLMETMVSILVLVLLVSGIGTGMDSGLKVYKVSAMESNSGSLAGIVNTALGDMLRYAEDISSETVVEKVIENGVEKEVSKTVLKTFTNKQNLLEDAAFTVDDGKIIITNRDGNQVDLVGKGSYTDLAIKDLVIYLGENQYGGYFEVKYDISSTIDSDYERHVETIVRHLYT